MLCSPHHGRPPLPFNRSAPLTSRPAMRPCTWKSGMTSRERSAGTNSYVCVAERARRSRGRGRVRLCSLQREASAKSSHQGLGAPKRRNRAANPSPSPSPSPSSSSRLASTMLASEATRLPWLSGTPCAWRGGRADHVRAPSQVARQPTADVAAAWRQSKPAGRQSRRGATHSGLPWAAPWCHWCGGTAPHHPAAAGPAAKGPAHALLLQG